MLVNVFLITGIIAKKFFLSAYQQTLNTSISLSFGSGNRLCCLRKYCSLFFCDIEVSSRKAVVGVSVDVTFSLNPNFFRS